MDDKDLARWAAKMARKGVRGAVGAPKPAAPPAPARQPEPQRWGAPPQPERAVPLRQAPPGTTWSPRSPESNVLVRPGPSAWDTMLQGVPDLAPDLSEGFDSMAGNVSPMSAALLREAGAEQDVPRSFQTAPTAAIAPLRDLPPAAGAGQMSIPGTDEKAN
jgi:hypothetical protein